MSDYMPQEMLKKKQLEINLTKDKVKEEKKELSYLSAMKYDEMKAYNRAPEFVYAQTEQGEYYADTENDTITMVVLNVLKESAKAVQVELETKDLNTGDFVAKKWTTWFPKSQIVALA